MDKNLAATMVKVETFLHDCFTYRPFYEGLIKYQHKNTA